MLVNPSSSSPSSQDNSISAPPGDYPGRLKKFGLLSQTISAGSQVRWILPARIRSRKHNDVIFVSDSSIQLRECLPDGTLFDATAKLNIEAQIQAANVVSAKLEKIPKEDLVLQQIWDEEQFSIRGKLCEDEQPPQILVLCTDAGDLIYIYASQPLDGSVKFVYAKRSILPGMPFSSKWGRHMAIDSGSKLLAVATSDAIAVFSLKDVDRLKTGIDSWMPRQQATFCPHNEQRFLPVDGSIIRLSFLRSPEDEDEKIFLLAIVAKAGRTQLVLYRWNIRESLTYLEPMKCSGYDLPIEDSFPILLIPAARPISFWIVTEHDMVFYDDIRSNKVKRIARPLETDPEATSRCLWVQWAKPHRHDQYEKDKEDILLVREDGITRYFSRTYRPLSNALIAVSPGELNMHVDKALCMLSGPRSSGGDILIVGGADMDSAVFWLGPRQLPVKQQIISSVSPLHDIICVDKQRNPELSSAWSQRIFGISGSGLMSRVTEVRFGLEAQSTATIPLEDCSTFNRLWSFEQEKEGFLYFLASNLERTVVLAQETSNITDLRLLEEGSPCALMTSEETLAVAKLNNGVIVQITPSLIRVVASPLQDKFDGSSQPLEQCVCADIDEKSGVFAAACVNTANSYIKIGMCVDTGQGPSIVMATNPYDSPRPFCMRLVQVNGIHVLVLGYFDGSVEILTIHPTGDITLKATSSGFEKTVAGISAIDILHAEPSSEIFILIGTLAGRLDVITCDMQQDNGHDLCDTSLKISYTMGLSRVFIKPDIAEGKELKSSFVSSDSRLAKVSLVSNGKCSDVILNDVWLTNRTNMSAAQPAIRTMSRIPSVKSNANCEWSRKVLFGASEELIGTNLIEQRHIIPRYISTCANARLLRYSDFFEKLVVIADGRAREDEASIGCPTIRLIDLDPTLSDTAEEAAAPIAFGNEGETATALLIWSPSDGKTHYNLVIVGVWNGNDGRIGHLSAKKLTSTPNGQAPLKTIMTLPHTEVHSICEYGNSSLVISAGNQLVLLHLEIEARKWSQKARYDLPSAAKSVSSRGVYVYAATVKHSMVVLKVEGNEFQLVFTDRAARNARDVVPFGKDGRHVLISTAHGGGTSLFGYMQGSSVSERPLPSFEARLPLPVDHVLPIRTRRTYADHYDFYGSTIDGTIYQFKTLTHEEYNLLHFLEKVSQPHISKPAHRRMSLLTKRMARAWVSKQEHASEHKSRPKNMHVNGDVIERLVDGDAKELRNMLEMKIKSEDDMMIDSDSNNPRRIRFEALATQVVGPQHDDQVGAVLVWARRLLRSAIL